MNETIIHFLQKQTSATVSCVDEKCRPYCFSCFYAFNFEEGLLYYKSSADSHHAQLMSTNPFVAGTVLPDKLNKLIVKGVQFQGMVQSPLIQMQWRLPAIITKNIRWLWPFPVLSGLYKSITLR